MDYDHSRLTEAQLAYAAGFIDGEGCITFLRNKCWGNNPMLVVSVVNTNKDVLWLLKNWFQCGSVCVVTSKDPSRLDRYTWTIKAKAAEMVLRSIQPFIVVKCNQIRIALVIRGLDERVSLDHRLLLVKELRSFNGRRYTYTPLSTGVSGEF